MARRWRRSEDAELARLYADGFPVVAIADRLGRSEDALIARRKHLGIAPRRGQLAWSADQDAFLRAALSVGIPAPKLAQHLHMTVDQVRRRRAEVLGAQRPTRRYQAWEDAAIRAAWARRPDVDDLARRLGRSPDAIRLRARVLSVHSPPSRARWMRFEDQALRRAYAEGLSCTEICDACLPSRSVGAVAARARKLGLANYARCWIDEEDRQLRLLLGRELAVDQIALALIRTPEAIRQRLRKLGRSAPAARPPRRGREPWSAAEDCLLRENRGGHPSVLASTLGRSDRAVRRRQMALGLRTTGRSPHHALVHTNSFTPAEDRLLQRELGVQAGAHGKRLLALSARLVHPPGELRRRLGELRSR